MMKQKERLHHDGKKLTFERSMDAEPLFGAIKANGELVNPTRDKSGRLYLGSIDPITAANWAKECGHAIGTKPFAAYAKKKLMSGEYAKFKAPVEKKVFGR